MSTQKDTSIEGATLLGHPSSLFVLFFAEMWERFSYYGMRALLVYYMIKGFLGYSDAEAYAVYGSYGALVYASPFIGGILADKLLGQRRAVIIGGALMAAGHLMMAIEDKTAFFVALALLICGNGFFKPNISTIVGQLYPENSDKKDSGFTLFYMGINLGAAMSGIVCGHIGETYGWHYGFGLATFGMLIGLAVFWAPRVLTQVLIGGGALAMAVGMMFIASNPILMAVNAFLSLALLFAAGCSVVAVQRGGLPPEAGAPPDPSRLDKPAVPELKKNSGNYYLAIIAAAILLGNVVAPMSAEAWMLVFVGCALILLPWLSANWSIYVGLMAVIPVISLLLQKNEFVVVLLGVIGGIALLSILREAFLAPKVEKERMFVMLVLMFFSMLFWAFFEQAGSSINNFTDRNIDRVEEAYQIDSSKFGQTIDIPITQEQIGYPWAGPDLESLVLSREERGVKAATVEQMLPGGIFTTTAYDAISQKEQKQAKKEKRTPQAVTVKWIVRAAHKGMGVAKDRSAEIKASVFQSANPIYILIFGLAFSWLWAFLGRYKKDPSTPVKFSLGLIQLGLGFGALWLGATQPDGRGMVSVSWLLLGYLLHTTGELCLSPVGLSMVTKLSPKRIVSTMMGAWFLATAFSGYMAGQIAQLTGVEAEGGGATVIPPPAETLGTYIEVFEGITYLAVGSGILVLLLSPVLTRWMHLDKPASAGDDSKSA